MLKINMDGLSLWEQFFNELDSFVKSVNRDRKYEKSLHHKLLLTGEALD